MDTYEIAPSPPFFKWRGGGGSMFSLISYTSIYNLATIGQAIHISWIDAFPSGSQLNQYDFLSDLSASRMFLISIGV